MADIAATGPLSTVFEALRTLIANVTFFQTWTGSADATEALTHIVIGEVGYRVKSLSVTDEIMTVTLAEPAPLTVGQVVSLDGLAIGAQGSVLISGGAEIASIGAGVQVPAVDVYGNFMRDSGGNIAYQISDEVLTFTLEFLNLADMEEFSPDGVSILPCLRPLIVITEDSENAMRGVSIATGGCNIQSGSIEVLVDARVAQGYRNHEHNAMYEARNALGKLIDGMLDLSGEDDYMLINNLNISAGPMFVDSAEQNDGTARFEHWRALLRVAWGFES